MNRQKAIADRDLARQTQIEELTPQLFKTNPAQYKETPTGMYVPQAPVAGAVAPNFSQQYVEGAPMRELISPETRTVDTAVLQQIASLSKDPMATLTAQADLIPKLRKAGLVQTTGQQDNPFEMFVTGAQSPTVRNLANQYSKSYLSGLIDPETADKRILELGKMDETFANKESTAAATKAQQDIANQLNQRQLELQEMVARGQMDQRQATLQLQQEAAAAKFQKPLPPSAQKIIGGHTDAAFNNVTLADNLDKVINNVVSSKIQFSPANNARLAINSATGSTDPDVMVYNTVQEFKKQFVNAKLVLNKGTQTEGDAIRAMDEISKARSTPDLIRSLQDLRTAYAKMAAQENAMATSKLKTFGLTEDKGYPSYFAAPIPQYNPVIYSGTSAEYKKLPIGSTYLNGVTGTLMKKTKD
jgi:hypothetical protein